MADNEKLSRHEMIRQLSDRGGLSIAQLTYLAIEENIYTPSVLETKAFVWAKGDCQEAMRKKGADGKPFAGPTEETDEQGGPVWLQRPLWPEGVYHLNEDQHMSLSGGNYQTARLLDEECVQRYGGRSRVPKIEAFENA